MGNIEIFESNDIKYYAWLKKHPGHFVVNTHRRSTTKYFILHTSECRWISVKRSKGAYSERNYIKVCASTQNELTTWFRNQRVNFEGEFNKCKTCAPTDDTAIESTYVDSDIPDDIPLLEGEKKETTTKRSARNQKAKKQCLAHYGYRCTVCSFDFAEKYGKIGKGFIHVHHLKEISESEGEHIVDPIKDLRPVCPNCHAMLHKKNPCLSIEALVKILMT